MSPEPIRRRPRDDAGMALMMTITCVVVSVALVTALLGALHSELAPVAYERRTARSMAAAEAGLQAELAVIRSAVSVNPLTGLGGDSTLLPCQYPTPMSGTVGGTPGNPAYAVTVRYFVSDPSNHDATWRAANALACAPGSGPVQVPYYALIEAVASSDAVAGLPIGLGGRAQEFVYTFSRTDAGVLGGLIRSGLYSTAGTNCWQAPSVPPSAGDGVSLAVCDQTTSRQLWSYRQDYSLVLSATQGSATPSTGGWCVSGDQAGWNSPIDATGNSNDAIPNGSPVWGANGPVSGSGITLDGSSAYLQTTTALATAPAQTTVGVWFKTTVANGYLFQYGNARDLTSASYDRMLYLNPTGSLVWGVVNGSAQTVTSPGIYTDGAWHYAVGSVGPLGLALYVDGVKVASRATPTTGQSFAGYWHLGGGTPSPSGWPGGPTAGYLNGSLAHAAVWSTQLSDAAVSGLFAQTGYAGFQGAVLALTPASYWALGGNNANVVVSMQACDGRPHQKWSYNDAGRFELERYDASALSGVCLYAADATGAPVVAQTCGGRDWTPAATVGAGAAGTATQQLVNFSEYGRCLDVTNWDVNYPWMIDYPCKQDPTHPVGGNQRWTYSSLTRQLNENFGANYCLTASATPGGRALTTACSGTNTLQTWTVNADTGVRATAYTIVDALGRCLSLGPPGTTTGGLASWSSIITETCDGTYKQKWNAPPQFAAAGVFAQRETTNGK